MTIEQAEKIIRNDQNRTIASVMTRKFALEGVRSDTVAFVDLLQGDRRKKDKKAMTLINEYADIEHVNDCVETCEKLITWIDQEIDKELALENDLLPEEGNPGYEAGQ